MVGAGVSGAVPLRPLFVFGAWSWQCVLRLKSTLLKVKRVYPGFTYDDTSNPGHLVIFPAEPHIQELPI